MGCVEHAPIDAEPEFECVLRRPMNTSMKEAMRRFFVVVSEPVTRKDVH